MRVKRQAAGVILAAFLVVSMLEPAWAQLAASSFEGTNALGTNYFLGKTAIGTNVPSDMLHVVGETRLEGGLSVDGALRVPKQGDISMGVYTSGVSMGGAESIGTGNVSTNRSQSYAVGTTQAFDVAAARTFLVDGFAVVTNPVAAGIASGDVANWGTAYAWGDHEAAGYATNAGVEGSGCLVMSNGTWVSLDISEETDPVFTDWAATSLSDYATNAGAAGAGLYAMSNNEWTTFAPGGGGGGGSGYTQIPLGTNWTTLNVKGGWNVEPSDRLAAVDGDYATHWGNAHLGRKKTISVFWDLGTVVTGKVVLMVNTYAESTSCFVPLQCLDSTNMFSNTKLTDGSYRSKTTWDNYVIQNNKAKSWTDTEPFLKVILFVGRYVGFQCAANGGKTGYFRLHEFQVWKEN